MAWGQLPKPGTRYGPCEPTCAHRDCAAARAMAAHLCRHCGKPIGYETAYVIDPDGLPVHRDCDWEESDRQRAASKVGDPRN